MNKTYKNIQDNVLAMVSRSDTETRNRIKSWINLGQQDFVSRELWPFREEVAQIAVESGTREYVLTDNLSDSIDANNIVSVVSLGNNGRKLSYVPFQGLRTLHPDLSVGSGPPEVYYLRAGSIGFYPTPSADSVIEVDYYIVPADLEADDDESIIPLTYREALFQYALSFEHDYNSDPDLAVKAMNRYEQILISARVNLLNQPVDSGAFRIAGPANSEWTSLPGER